MNELDAGASGNSLTPDRTIPTWLRLLLVGTALARLSFGVTLLITPSAIEALWPWAMTPVTARLLGASALVSTPLGFLAAWYDRWSLARIPIFMMLAYRVLQMVAGLLHVDRFDLSQPAAWNYFLGGGFMLAVLTFALIRGSSLGKPTHEPARRLPADMPLNLGAAVPSVLDMIGVVFFALGMIFLILGSGAGPLWIESAGRLTPLTARLFASPMVGLALGIWLIVRSARWREVAVPAVGMLTFGFVGSLTLILEWSSIAPPTAAGYLVVATPLILFLIGLYILWPARRGLGW